MEFFNLRSATSPTSKTQQYGRRISAERLAERVPTTPVTKRDVIQRTELFLKEPESGFGACLPVQEDLSAVRVLLLLELHYFKKLCIY